MTRNEHAELARNIKQIKDALVEAEINAKAMKAEKKKPAKETKDG
jgi:hypothetical protein